MNEILTFFIIALLLVISPGPNGILILKTASSKGKRASVENILGLVIATFVHGLVSVLGLSAIILQSAKLFTLVKYAGAAYLLYLGVKTILSTYKREPSKVDGDKSISSKHHQESIKSVASATVVNFSEGFFTQVLNPKVSMFYLAAFPQFINFELANYYSNAFLLVSIHAFTIFLWFVGVTIFIQKIRSLSKAGTLGSWFQRLSGGLLVYFSAVLATQEIKH